MFTKVDLIAIEQGNSDYLLDKGAKLYIEGKFEDAIRYYMIAASLGNMQAVSNLGYCYMYGRSVKKDMNLAIGFFKVAANAGIIEACAKLGSIYATDKYGMKDAELAIYYNETAMGLVRDFGIDPVEFPSLCLSFAKMRMPGGLMPEDIDLAYEYLRHAMLGYCNKVENGETFYEGALKEVKELLLSDSFRGYIVLDGFPDDMDEL